MKRYTILFGVAVALFIILMAIPAFSQEDETQAPVQAPAQAPAQAPVQTPAQETAKTGEISIYGEVQAVNASTNSITVQYYDYDNDEEKTLEITLDKDTKLENAKTIDEIKKGDWVDVAYIAGGGKTIAKTVSVEKEEPAAEEAAPAAAEE